MFAKSLVSFSKADSRYNAVKRWLEEVKVKSVFHLVVWYNSVNAVKRWLEEVKVKSVFHLVVV